MRGSFRTKLVAGVGSVLALAAATTAAQAETFSFSYTFTTAMDSNPTAGPYTITGTFNGTGPITDVTNITNVAAYLNGVALNGPLYTWSYTAAGSDCSTCFVLGGAVVSSNPLDNNFVFINSNDPPSGARTNYFYIIPWPNGVGNPVATQFFGPGTYSAGNNINYYNGQFAPDNWSLVQIPEPSTWAMGLIGFAALAYAGTRRRPARALI